MQVSDKLPFDDDPVGVEVCFDAALLAYREIFLVTVMWESVTTQFEDCGELLDGEIEIVGYQVIVEQEDPLLRVFSADVTFDVTSIVIPASFMLPGADYKFEVLAIEESGNQTLSEAELSMLE